MSAAELREAAALMRSRAEAAACAIGENWRMGDRSTLYTLEFQGNDDVWRNAFECGPCVVWSSELDAPKHEYVGTVEEPAEHIASWHPAVALAVADMLDSAAGHVEYTGDLVSEDVKHALTVARAYLGRSS